MVLDKQSGLGLYLLARYMQKISPEPDKWTDLLLDRAGRILLRGVEKDAKADS